MLRLTVDNSLTVDTLRLDVADSSLEILRTATPAASLEHATPLIRAVIRENAAKLLSVSATESLIHGLAEKDPALIRELTRSVPSTLEITRVLRGLLQERVSIRQLSPILESLVQPERAAVNLDTQIANARVAMGRFLIQPFLNPDGSLPYLQFDAFVETELLRRLEETPSDSRLLLPPPLRQALIESLHRAQKSHDTSLLIVPARIRISLYRLLQPELGTLSIMSWDEVPPGAPVVLLERLAA